MVRSRFIQNSPTIRASTLVNASVGLAVVDALTVCLNTFSTVETRPFKTTLRVTVSLPHAKQNPLSCLANIFVNEHFWCVEPAHAPRQPTGWIRIGYTGARINDSTPPPIETIITNWE